MLLLVYMGLHIGKFSPQWLISFGDDSIANLAVLANSGSEGPRLQCGCLEGKSCIFESLTTWLLYVVVIPSPRSRFPSSRCVGVLQGTNNCLDHN